MDNISHKCNRTYCADSHRQLSELPRKVNDTSFSFEGQGQGTSFEATHIDCLTAAGVSVAVANAFSANFDVSDRIVVLQGQKRGVDYRLIWPGHMNTLCGLFGRKALKGTLR